MIICPSYAIRGQVGGVSWFVTNAMKSVLPQMFLGKKPEEVQR